MKGVMKKLLNISLLVVLCFSALVFVGGKAEEDIRCYAYERVDGVYYACPGESVGIKVPYDPDVSGNINYSFSGCEGMSVRVAGRIIVLLLESQGNTTSLQKAIHHFYLMLIIDS